MVRGERCGPRFSGDSWATGKWGRADSTGVFRRLRRESGMNCVRFALQARYVKPSLDACVAEGFDLKGPKFWAATHSPETTYRDLLDECRQEGFEPIVTLLTSEEQRPTGTGSQPAYLGAPVGRWQVPVPKTLAELIAWEAYCEEVAAYLESAWPGLVRRFEIWNGFQGCGTPAAFSLIVRHAAHGVRRATPDVKLLPNPAGMSPPGDPERKRRLVHLFQHCADCVDGVSYQVSSRNESQVARSLPRQIRRWAEELTGRESLEVWQTRWRPTPPKTPDPSDSAQVPSTAALAAARRHQIADGLTGILHANLFGAATRHYEAYTREG